MRNLTCLACVVACNSGSPTSLIVEGGNPISIDEGQTLSVTITGPTKLVSPPSWVTLDGDQLTLAPPCDLVHTTSGPPNLQQIMFEGRSEPLLVEVHPSVAGTCQPKVLACWSDSCSQWADCTPETALGSTITTTFAKHDPDRYLVLTLANPDVMDPLSIKLTTDAPLKFDPRPANAPTSVCAIVPNNNVIGDFTLSYIVARTVDGVGPDASSPIVTVGSSRFNWNLMQDFGVELAWCATRQGPMGTLPSMCAIRRNITSTMFDACIERSISNPTANITLGLRVWAGHPHGVPSYALTFDATNNSGHPVVTSTLLQAVPPLTLLIERNTVPIELTADLGTAATDRLDITLVYLMSSWSLKIAVVPNCDLLPP